MVEGAYVQLEDAYCLRSVEEAMRIAEPVEVRRQSYWRGTRILFFALVVRFGQQQLKHR